MARTSRDRCSGRAGNASQTLNEENSRSGSDRDYREQHHAQAMRVKAKPKPRVSRSRRRLSRQEGWRAHIMLLISFSALDGTRLQAILLAVQEGPMPRTTRRVVVEFWHFHCPECGIGDGEAGH